MSKRICGTIPTYSQSKGRGVVSITKSRNILKKPNAKRKFKKLQLDKSETSGKSSECQSKSFLQKKDISIGVEKLLKRKLVFNGYDFLWISDCFNRFGRSSLRRVLASGCYVEDVILINIGTFGYIAICDNPKEGCFVKAYTRSEHSPNYHMVSSMIGRYNREGLEDIKKSLCSKDFSNLLEKVKGSSGFCVAQTKDALRIAQLVKSKVNMVYKQYVKVIQRRIEPFCRQPQEGEYISFDMK